MDDKETQTILTEADHVKSMIGSDGWKSVKDKLDIRLIDLQNMATLDRSNPETLNVQIDGRLLAVELIFAWLKADIYGFVEQQESNNKPVDKGTESFIGRE